MPPNSNDHVPSPKPDRLKLALQAIEKATMPGAAKRYLIDVLRAAANPNSERIDVVIASLPHDRRQNVNATTSEIGATAKAAVKRGRADLMNMDAAEWDRLVAEAADDQ